ncbi:MAG: hypothetical protein L6R40_001349 [Gallowayella cf. fulva]|nr:MAG: hypothetical protein L6R40_001349 [Xanthomendoza cf. fulva]
MVTAVLPSMVSKASSAAGQSRDAASNIEGFTRKNPNSGHARLAGFVGLFTGVGALGALGIFLPLPSRLQKVGLTPEKALADTYYIAGATAIVVAIACYVGLRGQLTALPLRDQDAARGNSIAQRASSTLSAITTVLKLGFTKPSLGLGFLASFVARSSSVGISLFIPLFVNASLCDHPAQDVEDVKAHCRKAYVIAAQLSGVSQLFALGFAPIFGYFPFSHNHFNLPLTVATLSGTVGYVLFARLNTSEISPGLLLIVALLGISQIGAIVTSLSLVSSFVMETVTPEDARSSDAGLVDDDGESTHLLHKPSTTETHEHLKGTIAGVYSFAGSLAILVLTKLGGVLFDRLGKEAPFYLLAIFNMGLFVAVVVCGGLNIYQTRRRTAV